MASVAVILNKGTRWQGFIIVKDWVMFLDKW